jgi:E3 ubiquitin-protein ligase SIAH1
MYIFFLGNIRNLGMEKVADTILFPCKYQTNGCVLNLMHKHKLEHEDCCDFRPVKMFFSSFSSSSD